MSHCPQFGPLDSRGRHRSTRCASFGYRHVKRLSRRNERPRCSKQQLLTTQVGDLAVVLSTRLEASLGTLIITVSPLSSLHTTSLSTFKPLLSQLETSLLTTSTRDLWLRSKARLRRIAFLSGLPSCVTMGTGAGSYSLLRCVLHILLKWCNFLHRLHSLP